MRNLHSCVVLLLALAVPAGVSAKGATTKVVITNPGLAHPIEITDYQVLKDFVVWAGPGVRVNGTEQTEGFIIDWAAGIVADPAGNLPRYKVSFYVGDDRRPVPEHQLAYVVSYTYDPAAERGYVYLPGNTDEDYRLNTRTILRGRALEGHWFSATSAWQHVLTPLIAPPA